MTAFFANLACVVFIAGGAYAAAKYLLDGYRAAVKEGKPQCVGCSACKMAGKCSHHKQ